MDKISARDVSEPSSGLTELMEALCVLNLEADKRMKIASSAEPVTWLASSYTSLPS